MDLALNPVALPLYEAPLCPAGHLPLNGGDWIAVVPSPITSEAREELSAKLPISPLVGEMTARTEGGALAQNLKHRTHSNPSNNPAAFSGPFCECICADVFASLAFIAGSVRQASILATSSASVQS